MSATLKFTNPRKVELSLGGRASVLEPDRVSSIASDRTSQTLDAAIQLAICADPRGETVAVRIFARALLAGDGARARALGGIAAIRRRSVGPRHYYAAEDFFPEPCSSARTLPSMIRSLLSRKSLARSRRYSAMLRNALSRRDSRETKACPNAQVLRPFF
jgi:hypothetical protein